MIVESFGVDDCRPWRIHWDHQIYKVLEIHYSAGLSTLIDRLPDIALDLIVRDDQVSFRPELEHARARFYKEVKRFAQIPYHFRGVSDEKELIYYFRLLSVEKIYSVNWMHFEQNIIHGFIQHRSTRPKYSLN